MRSITPVVLAVLLAFTAPAEAEPWTSPEEFLAERETDLCGIVEVKRVENYVHELRLPVLLVECEMLEPLVGASAWPAGETRTVVQAEYFEAWTQTLAPPATEGRRHLIWADEINFDIHDARLFAHLAGVLRIRRKADVEHVYWQSRNHSLSSIRKTIASNRIFDLDRVSSPVQRIEIAKRRVLTGKVGDVDAFIRGLMLTLSDPDGQAARVRKHEQFYARMSHGDSDLLYHLNEWSPGTHVLWSDSLAALRDFGAMDDHGARVIAALKPFTEHKDEQTRFAVALALATLKDTSGVEVLLRGFEEEITKPKRKGGREPVHFRGQKFGRSSRTAAAYALGLLGDTRGLKDDDANVRLAAAEALIKQSSEEVQSALTEIAPQFDKVVNKLREDGELFAPRSAYRCAKPVPREWIRTHRLLAQVGNDTSLRTLTEAWLEDFARNPDRAEWLVNNMPRALGEDFYYYHSILKAVVKSESDGEKLLARLRGLFGEDERWDQRPFVALREHLGDDVKLDSTPKPEAEAVPTKKEILKLIESEDRWKRREGLIAIGKHKVEELFPTLVDTALNKRDQNSSVAVESLKIWNGEQAEKMLHAVALEADLETRFHTLELLTRSSHPERFAEEVMQLARDLIEGTYADDDPFLGRERSLVFLQRVAVRLARRSLPPALLSGLSHYNERVRTFTVRVLAMAGDPAAHQHLVPLREDRNLRVRLQVKMALEILGEADL